MLAGMFLYVLDAILDQWLAPPEYVNQVWMIRLTALCTPVVVLALTFKPWFARSCNQLLAAVGLAAGVGLILMQCSCPLRTRPTTTP